MADQIVGHCLEQIDRVNIPDHARHDAFDNVVDDGLIRFSLSLNSAVRDVTTLRSEWSNRTPMNNKPPKIRTSPDNDCPIDMKSGLLERNPLPANRGRYRL